MKCMVCGEDRQCRRYHIKGMDRTQHEVRRYFSICGSCERRGRTREEQIEEETGIDAETVEYI